MGRRRKKEPKRNQICLRLTDRQLELLQRYVDFKEYDSEVEALRKMVDGLEDWLARQTSRRAIAGSGAGDTSTRASPTSDVGPRTDVTRRSDVAQRGDVAPPTRDLGESSRESRVGDFAGRPSVKLPEPRWNDGTGD